ncbi:LAFE_0G06964g1_1 [Lachancea fermentati]|uniref:LAFE_0G06964g1_1 n=1 Tax=Lachancea fermentati TaxID=4955 RepID=A0A1G4MHR8_LACFM|nr:LAFE_0G06964g1_1 [Lachancea fermentati]
MGLVTPPPILYLRVPDLVQSISFRLILMPFANPVGGLDDRGHRNLQNNRWSYAAGQAFAMVVPQDYNQRFTQLRAAPILLPSLPNHYNNVSNTHRRAVRNRGSPQKSQFPSSKNGSPTKARTQNHHTSSNNHAGGNFMVITGIKSCTDIKNPSPATTASRYMTKPSKLDSKRVKMNPVINDPIEKKKLVCYKLGEALLLQKETAPNSLIGFIDSRNDTFHKMQPIRVANEKDHQVQALDELVSIVRKYTTKPNRRSLAFSNTKLQTKPSKLQSQLSLEANDSVDLSFDGKAMNKSDIFKMVDSFSLMVDDDEDDHPLFNTANILPPEITS